MLSDLDQQHGPNVFKRGSPPLSPGGFAPFSPGGLPSVERSTRLFTRLDMLRKALKPALAALSLLSALVLSQGPRALPIVDLGYEIHQASSFNVRPCP